MTDCRFSAVFALDRVWRDHKAAETGLEIEWFFFFILFFVFFFMQAYMGTEECWFSLSDSCVHACTEKPKCGCFFNHLFKGVFFFFFLSLEPPISFVLLVLGLLQ